VEGTSGAEEQDQMRESRAWNNSILLMMAAPYVLATLVGFGIWRGLRQRARLEQQAEQEAAAATRQGGLTCSMLSPADVSSRPA
jgi:hypothetical protein